MIILIFCLLHASFNFPIKYFKTNQEIDKSAITFLKNKHTNKHQCDQDSQLYSIQSNSAKPFNALIICGLHARQLISSEICVQFFKKYLNRPDTGQPFNVEIFLNANHERNKVIQSNRLIRKNEFGVDLNRNFPYRFHLEKSSKRGDTYHGEKPLNQPFTRCVDQRLKSKVWDAFIDIHSGELALYYVNTTDNQSNIKNQRVLKYIKNEICHECDLIDLSKQGEKIQFPLTGQSYAYAKQKYRIQYSFLFEVYKSKSRFLTLETYNPPTKLDIQLLVDHWSNALIKILGEIAEIEKEKTIQ